MFVIYYNRKSSSILFDAVNVIRIMLRLLFSFFFFFYAVRIYLIYYFSLEINSTRVSSLFKGDYFQINEITFLWLSFSGIVKYEKTIRICHSEIANFSLDRALLLAHKIKFFFAYLQPIACIADRRARSV